MQVKIFVSMVLCLFLFYGNIKAETGILKDIKADKSVIYIIRLNNGDLITGSIIEFVNDPDEGEGIKVKTEIGNALIFENQIKEINIQSNNYRHTHRVFILPTADPIGDDHFIGIWEMLFLYAGAGIGDIVSITAGRSLIPGINSNQQVTELNVKATLLSTEFESVGRVMTIALGGNYLMVNDANKMQHIYGVGTFKFGKSNLTFATFYKLGSQDFFTAYFNNNAINVNYPDGAVGIGLGLDTRISSRHDFRVIGELWNNDVAHPTHTGILLGLRLANTSLSADFGLAFFTQPLAAPFMSFVWTPF